MTENIFTVCKTYLWLHVFFYKCHIFSVKDLYQRTNWYFKSTQKCCACNFYYKSTNVCSQMQNFFLLFTLQGEKNLKTLWIHLIWSKVGLFFHLWITESISLLSVYPLKLFIFLIWMIRKCSWKHHRNSEVAQKVWTCKIWWISTEKVWETESSWAWMFATEPEWLICLSIKSVMSLSGS